MIPQFEGVAIPQHQTETYSILGECPPRWLGCGVSPYDVLHKQGIEIGQQFATQIGELLVFSGPVSSMIDCSDQSRNGFFSTASALWKFLHDPRDYFPVGYHPQVHLQVILLPQLTQTVPFLPNKTFGVHDSRDVSMWGGNHRLSSRGPIH